MFKDLQLGIRTLAKSPGFALIIIGTLALGIGASTSIYSIVHAVLYRPLPYDEPGRIVVNLHKGDNPTSPADYLYWREHAQTFEHLAATEAWSPNLTGRDEAEQIRGLRTTGLFTLLGVEPVLGRTFVSGDDRMDSQLVAILSHSLWQRRFGGRREILDQPLILDGQPHRIVGVMPAGFEFPLFWYTGVEVWTTLKLEPRANSHGQSLRVFGRLKDNAALSAAQSEMDVIAGQLEAAFPRWNTDWPISVIPLHEKIVGNVRPTLLVLFGSVGLVMLIACSNAASLLLARATARQREIGVRLALGASRLRIARQVLVETAVLALPGGAAGLLAANWCRELFTASLPAEILPRQSNLQMDGRVVAFSLLLSLATVLAAGVVPAARASRFQLQRWTRNRTPRRMLVIAEIALAMTLLTGAGLMTRTFAALQSVDPGFVPENVLTMTVSVAGTTQSPGPRRIAFFDELMARIAGMPGVVSVSATNHLPLYGDRWVWPISIEDQPEPQPGALPNAVYRVSRPDYFRTMGIAITTGRDFSSHDNAQSLKVGIVNESMARKHWPGEGAVGKRFRLGTQGNWITVVGVAKNVKNSDWKEEANAEIYLPYLQSPDHMNSPAPHFSYLTVVIRTESAPEKLTGAVRNAVRELESNAPVSSVMTMEDVVSGVLARSRLSMVLLGFFGLTGLVLAAVGIYGMMSYAVAIRTQEIGIRTALGAGPQAILQLVMTEGLVLTVTGVILGMIASLALGSLMSTLLFGVGPADTTTFAGITLVLIIVSAAACFVPARRALRVDPIHALRAL